MGLHCAWCKYILVLAISLITTRLDPGWGLGQAFYTMFITCCSLLYLVLRTLLVVYVQYVILVHLVCLYAICAILCYK